MNVPYLIEGWHLYEEAINHQAPIGTDDSGEAAHEKNEPRPLCLVVTVGDEPG